MGSLWACLLQQLDHSGRCELVQKSKKGDQLQETLDQFLSTAAPESANSTAAGAAEQGNGAGAGNINSRRRRRSGMGAAAAAVAPCLEACARAHRYAKVSQSRLGWRLSDCRGQCGDVPFLAKPFCYRAKGLPGTRPQDSLGRLIAARPLRAVWCAHVRCRHRAGVQAGAPQVGVCQRLSECVEATCAGDEPAGPGSRGNSSDGASVPSGRGYLDVLRFVGSGCRAPWHPSNTGAGRRRRFVSLGLMALLFPKEGGDDEGEYGDDEYGDSGE